MEEKPLVSVVIPVYNRRENIQRCLESALKQTYRNHEIIIIDDGSTDGTREILNKYALQVKLYFHQTNKGVSYARNQGVRLSRGEFVAMLDSDCDADPNWLEELIKPFYRDKDVMIVGGRVTDMLTQNYWQMVNNSFNTFVSHNDGYVGRVIGCNMAFRREFVMRYPYNERLKFAAGDDTELCWQCRRLGFNVFYTHQARVSHYHRNTLQNSVVQQFLYGYITTYMFVKFNHFPYAPYGSHVILLMIALLLMGYLGLSIAFKAAWVCLFIFLYLPYYHGRVAKVRNMTQTILAYPGHLILYTGFCIGCLVYFFIPRMFMQKPQDSKGI